MFIPINKIIPKALSKLRLMDQAKAALVCEKYRRTITDEISPKALVNTWPKHFRRGTLTIGVIHPIWADEIMQRKHRLLKRINDSIMEEWPSLKKAPVSDIKTMVSEAPEEKY